MEDNGSDVHEARYNEEGMLDQISCGWESEWYLDGYAKDAWRKHVESSDSWQ